MDFTDEQETQTEACLQFEKGGVGIIEAIMWQECTYNGVEQKVRGHNALLLHCPKHGPYLIHFA